MGLIGSGSLDSTTGGAPGGQMSAGPAEDRGPQTVIIVWVLVACSTIFLGLRLYCKCRYTKGLWYDDWVLIASWICFIIDAAMTSAVVSLGFGKLPRFIDQRNFPLLGLYANIGQTFGILAVAWSKTAFAIMLLRLTTDKTKVVVWFIVVSLNVFFGLLALFTWVSCTPASKTWDREKPGTCWNQDALNGYNGFTGVYSGVMDISLAMLPWVLIWNLQMKRMEKAGVGIAMSMGVFAGATAFIKTSKVRTIGSDNFTLVGTELLIWAGAEIATTIMASCIPSMRVLVREVGTSALRAYASGYGSGAATRSGGGRSKASGAQSKSSSGAGSSRARTAASTITTVTTGASTWPAKACGGDGGGQSALPVPRPTKNKQQQTGRDDEAELSESEREMLPMQGCRCECHEGHGASGGRRILRTRAFDVESQSRAGSSLSGRDETDYEMAAVIVR